MENFHFHFPSLTPGISGERRGAGGGGAEEEQGADAEGGEGEAAGGGELSMSISNADFLNVIDYKYKCQCHSGGELFNTAAGRREGRQGSRR